MEPLKLNGKRCVFPILQLERWRKDLFCGWDFYDISQCKEFQRAGYDVVVPYMEKPWCIHDDGILNLEHYNTDRVIFLEEYQADIRKFGGRR